MRAIALAVSLRAASFAFAQDAGHWPKGAEVYFISPHNGAKVKNPVVVRFGLKGLGIAPAGVKAENTGHHHLLIDTDLPANLDQPLPSTDNIKHFGKGQTETELTLPPGKHTLQLVVGDENHIPHSPPLVSKKITITVQGGAAPERDGPLRCARHVTPARAILHVDMDAFFASIEQHDHQSLIGRPVIVGGTAGRGVVAAASYEVRRYGVRSAMPMRTALERCPHAVCIPPRMARYQEVSRQIFAIFHEITPLVQGLSLDEAYLDVSAQPEPAAALARRIKGCIRERTGLTASVGVAPNKLIAKIASDLDKPDGLTIVLPQAVQAVLDPLSVRRLPGLGRKTGAAVEALGITTLGALRRAPDATLWPLFGRYTQRIRERAAGIDERPVVADRDEKSLSAEDTFARDSDDPRALTAALASLADRACARLRQRGLAAASITIKIRRHDFATFTRRRAVSPPVRDRRSVARIATELLARWLAEHPGTKLRLLGVALSDLSPATQLGLFEAERSGLDDAVDAIHGRFGTRALKCASSIK